MGYGLNYKKNMKNIIVKLLAASVIFVVLFILLLPGIKGTNDDLRYYENTYNRELGGPFESSGSTSRYRLTETFSREGRVVFNKEEASFASPDVVGTKGKYFSLFMPGLSLAAVPLYKIGEYFGYAQVITYAVNILFSLLNVLFIYLIFKKLGGGKWVSLFAGYVFLFATSAFAYAFYFTQHHISTFSFLLIFYLFFLNRNIYTNILAGLVYGYAIFIDIPNAFILLPVMTATFFRNFQVIKEDDKASLKIKYSIVGLILGFLPMLFIIGSYNKITTGSFTHLPQFIGRSQEFSVQTSTKAVPTKPAQNKTSSQFEPNTPFVTRFIANGMYILLGSNERGLLVYSPVLFIGIIGLYIGLKKNNNNLRFFQVLFATIVINILVYAMFGDPWGGWSYGPRYLIPAAACMSILMAVSIYHYKNKLLLILIVSILFAYSTFVNTLGAITTTQVPPKQEAINLATNIPYTYTYNLDLLRQERTRSFIYNSYLKKYISSMDFFSVYWSVILISGGVLYIFAILEKEKST